MLLQVREGIPSQSAVVSMAWGSCNPRCGLSGAHVTKGVPAFRGKSRGVSALLYPDNNLDLRTWWMQV